MIFSGREILVNVDLVNYDILVNVDLLCLHVWVL